MADKTLEDLLIEATAVYQHCEYILTRYMDIYPDGDPQELDYLKKELLKQSRAHERMTKRIKSMREEQFLSSPHHVKEDESIPMRWLLRSHGIDLDSL